MAESGEAADSLTWLHSELPGYRPQREALAAVLRYLAALTADHWRQDAAAARLVAGTVDNDHVCPPLSPHPHPRPDDFRPGPPCHGRPLPTVGLDYAASRTVARRPC